ncbi:DUF4913 domain-containing protein [Glycomyces terrestris]|uniref:DUF4913 domain-containing protein n=1 Tax=Glycomyces terrestris TaxID=2493553 RepID=A0A426V2U5_9ACTN|nr:DUF4913 domain-containing protein [Glycomyces terrestris]RRS01233.1 DUF4913 domain-containing protein [Glycomyces terrestris]
MSTFNDDGPDASPEEVRADEEQLDRESELFYGNVNEFVEDRFVYFVNLPAAGSGRVWCPEWYRHAQALSRLDSLWRAWEHLRFDPALGMSAWWTQHLDPHWRALTDPVTGPFVNCVGGHGGAEPLPVASPPDGLFTDQRGTASDPLALS